MLISFYLIKLQIMNSVYVRSVLVNRIKLNKMYELMNACHANVSAFVTIFRIIFNTAYYADVENSWQRARVCSTWRHHRFQTPIQLRCIDCAYFIPSRFLHLIPASFSPFSSFSIPPPRLMYAMPKDSTAIPKGNHSRGKNSEKLSKNYKKNSEINYSLDRINSLSFHYTRE